MTDIGTVVISTITAIGGYYVSYFFSTKKAEKDARRDYEFNARKALYEEYEPLVFQMHELCDDAYGRITNLAENLRNGRLPVAGGEKLSISQPYIINSIYRILAPLAIFKLMERRLTLFDLDLDKHFKMEYLFAKALYNLFRNQVPNQTLRRSSVNLHLLAFRQSSHSGDDLLPTRTCQSWSNCSLGRNEE
jgi:hypothetical protein